MKENKVYYVYEHIRLDNNEVFYVGIGTKNTNGAYKYNKYIRGYYKCASKRSKFWHNVFESCGRKIKVNIVFETTSLSSVKNKEIELIKRYGRRDLGRGALVNLTEGGDGTFGHKWTKKQREEKSIASKGKGNPFYGKNHSTKTRQILSKQRVGKHIGKGNPFYGKTHSEDTKKAIKKLQKKKWEDGELKPPPPQKGKDNFFATTYICINHSTGDTYKVEGGIKRFCEKHDLSYDYVKRYKNKGVINLKKHSKMRRKAINTLNWEFKQQ